MADKDDWRLMGRERYLQSATLRWKTYYRWSEDCDHDHCEFCGTKFLPPIIRTKSRMLSTKAMPLRVMKSFRMIITGSARSVMQTSRTCSTGRWWAKFSESAF